LIHQIASGTDAGRFARRWFGIDDSPVGDESNENSLTGRLN
jgi:hypothetical protein